MAFDKFSSASIYINGDFVNIRTLSGRGLMGVDSSGLNAVLPADVDDSTLGCSIIEALRKSRWLSVYECASFFDRDERKRVYEQWVSDLMESFGYKKRRELFKNMMNCSVIDRSGSVEIRPTNHDKSEAWSGRGISHEDHVHRSLDSSAEEMGVAVRLAISRCR